MLRVPITHVRNNHLTESFVLSPVKVFKNVALNSGAGIFAVDINLSAKSSVSIINSYILSNTAVTGAGVCSLSVNVIVATSTIMGNEAADVGGGVYVVIDTPGFRQLDVNISNNRILNNSASSGGGINLKGTKLSRIRCNVEESDFEGNNAV